MRAVTSANSLKMGMILFTKFGVSDTKTNLGFGTVLRLSMAFRMHCIAACKPRTDLITEAHYSVKGKDYKSDSHPWFLSIKWNVLAEDMVDSILIASCSREQEITLVK